MVLRQFNIPVYVADPKTVEALLSSIQQIGSLTQRQKEAEQLVTHIKKGIDTITQKIMESPQKKRPNVFIEIWDDPLTTAAGDSFINELIRLAGGENIAAGNKKAFTTISAEEIIKKNPDIILLAYMDNPSAVKRVKERFGWDVLNAVKNEHIIREDNPDIFLRPGPRIVDAIESLYTQLYLSHEK
jgi:iron complex transport system substrate-binding protein